jgi:hypothetical protein
MFVASFGSVCKNIVLVLWNSASELCDLGAKWKSGIILTIRLPELVTEQVRKRTETSDAYLV